MTSEAGGGSATPYGMKLADQVRHGEVLDGVDLARLDLSGTILAGGVLNKPTCAAPI